MAGSFFISAALQKKFDQDGFVKVELLSRGQALSLADAYEQFRVAHEAIDLPYITTSHSSDPILITKVDQVLQQVMAPAIERYLDDYKLLFGNYLVKMPVANSESKPHQDITFVDESRYISVNIWVALQDTDESNGCMYFLPGSHRFIPTIRPTHSYPWTYEHTIAEIRKASISYPCRAGEAFIFHHGVLHGSHANTSARPRLAAVMAAYSAGADLIHYYLPDIKSNRLEKYAMDKDAYLYFEKEKAPAKGVLIGEETHEFRQLSRGEFLSLADPGYNHYSQKAAGLLKRRSRQ